jgi:hypothetical protein
MLIGSSMRPVLGSSRPLSSGARVRRAIGLFALPLAALAMPLTSHAQEPEPDSFVALPDFAPATPVGAPAVGLDAPWSPTGQRLLWTHDLPRGELRLRQAMPTLTGAGWAATDLHLIDATGDAAATRVSLEFSLPLRPYLELRLDAGVGASISSFAPATLEASAQAQVIWWFADHWGVGTGVGYRVRTPSLTPATDSIGYQGEFRNETPWDGDQPMGDGSWVRELFGVLQLMHR